MEEEVQWKIQHLEIINDVNNLNGVVYSLVWMAYLTGPDNMPVSEFGKVTLNDPDPETFLPLPELTEELVLSWLFQNISIEEKENIENSVIEKYAERMEPKPTLIIPPWIDSSVYYQTNSEE